MKRVCHVEWGNSFARRRGGGNSFVGRQGGGTRFLMGVGNASGIGGGKNVEGERSKGKGCAWKRARSERGASPWPLRHWRRSRLGSRRLTRKERTRILRRTQKRGVHARAADVRLLFRNTFEYVGRKRKKRKTSASNCARVYGRNFEVRLVVFFFWWIFLVIHGATRWFVPRYQSKRAAPIFG